MTDHATTFSGNFWNLYSMTTLPLSLKYLATLFALLQPCSSGSDVNLLISLAANYMSILPWPK